MLPYSQKTYQRLYDQERQYHFRVTMFVLSCLERFLFPEGFQLSFSWNAMGWAQILGKP